MKQYAAIDDVVYFWFGANDTSGSGGDGASPAADVRLAGAAADAIPVYSPTPALLSHANYPSGAYEIAITASVANGFATGNTYAVFCTLAIDSQNPTGFVGSFDTKPIESNITQIGDAAQSATDLKDMVDTGYDPTNHKIQSDLIYIHGSALTETAGQLAAAFVKLFDVATPLLVASDVMRGTEAAALAATALSDVTWTDAKAAFLDHSIATVDGNVDDILLDTGTTIPGAITTMQANLDNPSQYKADVSALALEATVAALNDITVADIIAGIADGTYDLQEMMRIIFSACCLKVSGGGTTTISTRDSDDAKYRIVATVDENGNRTAVTLDGS